MASSDAPANMMRMNQLNDRAKCYMKEQGYVVEEMNGQRHSINKHYYPLPEAADQAEQKHEIYVYKILDDMFEPELYPIFKKFGTVLKIRIMRYFSQGNRGFCFVQYLTRDEAQLACEEIQDYPMRVSNGVAQTQLAAQHSFDNRRLFFAGLPTGVSARQLIGELSKVVDGIEDLELMRPIKPNRRHAIVTFKSHLAATKARRVLVPCNVKVFGNDINVEWAKPQKNNIMNSSVTTQPMLYPGNYNGCSNPSASSIISFPSNKTTAVAFDSSFLAPSLSPDFNLSNSFDNNNNSLNTYDHDLLSAPQTSQGLIDVTNIYRSNILGNKTVAMLSNPLPIGHASTIPSTSNYHFNLANAAIRRPNSIYNQSIGSIETENHQINMDRAVTVSNVDSSKVNDQQLLTIFELSGRLPISYFKKLADGYIFVVYTNAQDADSMFRIINEHRQSFASLAQPNKQVFAVKGGSL